MSHSPIIARVIDAGVGQPVGVSGLTGWPAWLYKLLRRIEAGEGSDADLRTIDSVGGYMEGQTICALSDAAAWAATGFLRRFRAEFEQHVRERRCPLPESFEA